MASFARSPISFIGRTGIFCLACLLALGLVSAPPAQAQGLQVLAVSTSTDQIYVIDPLKDGFLSSQTITLTGFNVLGATGLAVQPGTGVVFATLLVGTPGVFNTPRRLVTINPANGVATDIGLIDDGNGLRIADITFASDGTLYGVTGDGGASPETLFTINTATGAPTLATALGNGSDGEAIGFNPNDGLIYHASGLGTVVFETVDPANGFAVTDIPLLGPDTFEELGALVFWGNNIFLAGDVCCGDLKIVTSGGVVQLLGSNLLGGFVSGLAILGTPAAACNAPGTACGLANHNGAMGVTPQVLYSIDLATGAASMIGPTNFGSDLHGHLAFRADGTLFATGPRLGTFGGPDHALFTVDPATGAATEVGPTGIENFSSLSGVMTGISFRPSDSALFGMIDVPSFGSVNTSTGTFSPIGSAGGCAQGFAFDLDDTLFDAGDATPFMNFCSIDTLDTIDPTTGNRTSGPTLNMGTLAGGDGHIAAMTFDPNTGTLFAAVEWNNETNYNLATLNKATGVVTDIGASQFGLNAIAIAPPPTGADLAVTKTDSPDPITLGAGDITYTVTVSNAGPTAATNVMLTDTFTGAAVNLVSAVPSQGSCNTAGFPSFTCDLGTINSGANATVDIVVTPTAAGTVTNTASATATETDPNGANNTNIAESTTVLAAAGADLAVTKTDSPDPITLGAGNITYTVTVSNAGPDPATNVMLTDAFTGAAVTHVSTTPAQGTCNTAGFPNITCDLGTIAAASNTTMVIVVTPTAAGTVTNTASATATEADADAANNTNIAQSTTVSPAPPGADLVVTKTDSPDPITLGGGNITYTVTISNAGPDAATNVVLTDTFSGAGVTLVSAAPSQGSCNTAGFPSFPCDLGTINSGANATVSIVVTPTAAGTVTNTASATATETDPNGANNTNIAQSTTVSPAGGDFSLSASPASLTTVRGSTVTALIRVMPLPSVGSVDLTCTASIPGGGCSISPGTVNPGSAQATATLNIFTSEVSATRRKPSEQRPLYAVWLPVAGFGAVGLVLLGGRRRRQKGGKSAILLVGLMSLLLWGSLVAGCSRFEPGKPVTYVVTVSGTGGGQTHSVDVSVNVLP